LDEKMNGRVKLWVYAVVLFTSAFIVLLITAYSQIKVNRNIVEYREQIYKDENEKRKFLLNLNSALEENMKLVNELKTLKEKLDEYESKLEELEEREEKSRKKIDNISAAYENLAAAFNDYENENPVSSAERLKNDIKTELLGTEGLRQYRQLWELSHKKAAHELYLKGYNSYRNKDFRTATDYLNKSLGFADDMIFSGDCYFLLANSEYKQGNVDAAKKYLYILLEKYPSSSYAEEARNLLNKFVE
jgi:TolA-binding protein